MSGRVAPAEATRLGVEDALPEPQSFDGRTIYYVKTRSSPQPLFARTLGAPGERKVVEAILGRDFAVDETGIVYFTWGAQPGTVSLRHIEPDTTKTREVTTLDVLPTLGLSASRDGRTIIFAATKPSNDDLFLIENFR